MEEIRLEIQHAIDGRQERSIVQSARVTIGSGAHCDVRLPADQAAFEHVLIEMLPNATRLQRVAPMPVATLDGAPFTVASLGVAGTGTLTIGGTVIRIERAAVVEPEKPATLSGAVLAKGTVLLALLGTIFYVSSLPAPAVGSAPATLPDPFPSHAVVCSRTDPSEARAVAVDTLAIADGARERSAFEPREALAAVGAYDLAAACFRLAGDPRADDASRSARESEEATRTELRARRVRLERMLVTADYEIARQDVVVLRALLDGQRGDYVVWLKSVELDLKNKRL